MVAAEEEKEDLAGETVVEIEDQEEMIEDLDGTIEAPDVTIADLDAQVAAEMVEETADHTSQQPASCPKTRKGIKLLRAYQNRV